MADNRFYVYAHRRKDTDVISYIGKGAGRRAWARSGRNSLWSNIDRAHGFNVEIIRAGLTEEDAFEVEREMIAQLGPECNFTDGGEGISGYRHTPETKAAIRAAHAGKPQPKDVVERRALKLRGKKRSAEFSAAVSARMTGRVHTDETKAKMSAARTGQRRSEEAVLKTAAAHRGKKRSEDARKHMSEAQPKRRVICVDTGDAFPSITAAAAWLRLNGWSKATKTGVWSALTGRREMSYGFKWAYADGSNP